MPAMKQDNDKQDLILLVEDNQSFSKVLSRALNRRNYQVEIIAIVDQAIEWLDKQSKIDVDKQNFKYAILDLKLDSETSLPLISIIKDLFPEVKILVLTGYASITTAVEAIRLGASNYLPKPADTDEILNALLNDAPNPDLELNEDRMSVERLEWEHIQKVLKENDNNISKTARQLNMHRRTLQRKLQKKPVQK